MSRRPPRALTPEERRLWQEVARSISPLAGRLPPAVVEEGTTLAQPPPVPPPEPKSGLSRKDVAARSLRQVLAPASPSVAPPGLERRLRVSLRRGTAGVDAVLDLHGMRQAEAHGALRAFLVRSQRDGHRLVLIVTGKGVTGKGDGPATAGRSSQDPFGERGVLRRSVPLWLASPDMRRLVVGIDEAGRRHGGDGALYLRLRRADRPG